MYDKGYEGRIETEFLQKPVASSDWTDELVDC